MPRRRGPEHGPWILRAVTWGYFAWTLLPLIIAVRASFTDQPLANGAPAGWSLRNYRVVLDNPDSLRMMWHSLVLAALTVLIAVPMGAAAAIFIGRRSGRSTLTLASIILAAIAVPQTLLSANLLFLSIAVKARVGSVTQLIGHVTVALPFVILIVLVGIRGVAREQEDSAMDLGAPPLQAMRRVVFPMLGPSLLAATSIAFVLSYDNFVVSQWLCIETAACETVPMSLFGRGGVANPGAGSYALATMALAVSATIATVIALGWVHARRRTRLG